VPARVRTGFCVGRNETASKRYFHTSLAQARSDIHIVGGVANPANRIAGQERAIPPLYIKTQKGVIIE